MWLIELHVARELLVGLEVKFMAGFWRDLRYAARVLLKTPATAAVAVLALALGIGVNASCFIMVESVILHPLPFPNLDRIVAVWETLPKMQTQREALAPANLRDLKEQNQSFAELAAFRNWNASLTGRGNAERVRAAKVSPNFFSLLGSKAARGRTFFGDEDEPDHANVAVVSEAFWKRQLAGSPEAVGKDITLSGRKYTVVGVMPDRFDFPLGTEVWSPMTLSLAEQEERASHTLMVLGRLKPGVALTQSQSEVAAIASRLATQYRDTNQGRTLLVLPLRESAEEGVTNRFLLTLLGGAGFVLLLACANIGNLQVARAANRHREIAVRSALGASRMQVARQLFAETVLLSAAAALVGILLASWHNDYVKTTIPAFAMRIVPGLRTMRVDSTVMLLTVVVSLVTGLLCSLPAMIQVMLGRMGGDLGDALRARAGYRTHPHSRLRTVLIASELALALVLLVGAGLMVQTFKRLLNLNQGFDSKNLLTMEVSLPTADYRQPRERTDFFNRALLDLNRMPGVWAAGLSTPEGRATQFRVEGRPEPQPGEPRPDVTAISGGYLEAMRIPLLEGRLLSEEDKQKARRVAVISASVARYYWPKSDALGQRIQLDSQSGWVTIVGVCGDVIWDWFRGQATATAYVSYLQSPPVWARIVVRTKGDPLEEASGARAIIRQIDRDLPVYEVKSQEQRLFEETSGVRAAARTMISYAVIALLLAVTGVYAVVSYFVAARTHDIGVRMALGADRSDVFRMTMRQSARLALIGLAAGMPLAVLLSHAMSSALFNVVAVTPAAFAGFACVLLIAALFASYLPARRAMQIDPITALRQE